jgi:hypothetical protein
MTLISLHSLYSSQLKSHQDGTTYSNAAWIEGLNWTFIIGLRFA